SLDAADTPALGEAAANQGPPDDHAHGEQPDQRAGYQATLQDQAKAEYLQRQRQQAQHQGRDDGLPIVAAGLDHAIAYPQALDQQGAGGPSWKALRFRWASTQ